ncbi:MAG TPA: rhodanese-like domain-containing protein [Thermoanaerobaculia bacterium]|nr:rhodanese-like domain-containing protein [Thermoanaerobaculia bacterium]
MSHRGRALAGGVLLAVAAAPAFAAPQSPSKPPSLTPRAAAPAEKPMTPATEETARRITVDEARQALAKGKAVLVDVRSKEAYEGSHAEGALSIPLADLGARAGELPKDKLIVTYCT